MGKHGCESLHRGGGGGELGPFGGGKHMNHGGNDRW